MYITRLFPSHAIGIGLLFIFSIPGWAATLKDPREPTDEEILRLIYPDGELSTDQQKHVIKGGRYAEDNVYGEGIAPKVIERIERLRGRLYQKDREELVVLVKATNNDAPECCKGEAVLVVFDVRGQNIKPVWIHRLRHIRLVNANVSLIEANSYGTQQILFKYETRSGVVQQTAIIYIPRPSPAWSQPTTWSKSESMSWVNEDTADQPFVNIWFGTLKWDESSYFYYQHSPQPRGSNFPRTAYTSEISLSEPPTAGWAGWRDLIEERTITRLLGKTLDPPLKIKVRYLMSSVYYIQE